MKIKWMMAHKVLGLSAGLLNVLAAAAVLQQETAFFYLSALSAAQLFMVGAGFGLNHRLIALPYDEAIKLRAWPWFVGSILAGWAVFGAMRWRAHEASDLDAVLVFMSALLILIVLSEWLRAVRSTQIGFVIYNVLLLIAALLFLILGEFHLWLAGLPLIGTGILLAIGLPVFRGGAQAVRMQASDVLRAAKVALVNQFFNGVALIAALTSTGSENLVLLLALRFGILFNWQSFFWLRFLHRSLAGEISDDHRRKNRGYVLVNLASSVGVLVVFGVMILIGLDLTAISPELDADFLILLSIFAVSRVLMSLVFPYELFVLYTASSVGTARFTWALFAGILFLVGVCLLTQSPFIILPAAEAVWLAWRLFARHQLARSKPGLEG
jgi:hypothetical protein